MQLFQSYRLLFLCFCLLSLKAIGQTDSSSAFRNGLTQFNAANYEGAEIEFQKAVKQTPKNPEAYYYVAELSFILHDEKKSMENYNAALEIDSTNAKCYKGRGRIKAKMEDYNGALEDFSKAIKWHKKYSDAYFNRGLSYVNLKEYKLAIADFTEVIRINSKDYQAYVERGTAKIQLGDKKGACADWSKAGELGYFKIYDSIKKNCN